MDLPAPGNLYEMLGSLRTLDWHAGNACNMFPNVNYEVSDPLIWPSTKGFNAPYAMWMHLKPIVICEVFKNLSENYKRNKSRPSDLFHRIVVDAFRLAIPQAFSLGATIQCQCTSRRIWIAAINDITVIYMKSQNRTVQQLAHDVQDNNLTDELELLHHTTVNCNRHEQRRVHYNMFGN